MLGKDSYLWENGESRITSPDSSGIDCFSF